MSWVSRCVCVCLLSHYKPCLRNFRAHLTLTIKTLWIVKKNTTACRKKRIRRRRNCAQIHSMWNTRMAAIEGSQKTQQAARNKIACVIAIYWTDGYHSFAIMQIFVLVCLRTSFLIWRCCYGSRSLPWYNVLHYTQFYCSVCVVVIIRMANVCLTELTEQ